jgi:hypothetical protein
MTFSTDATIAIQFCYPHEPGVLIPHAIGPEHPRWRGNGRPEIQFLLFWVPSVIRLD